MWWQCDCGYETWSEPTGHSDWGGEIKVIGPDCPECHIAMDYLDDGPPPSP